ncbi:MAG: LLM class flavin-dependent oxidoreductase [Gammaproteobacteria bacterium]|nr:LLM class flavin-dependent oxidoreductase [Gammaproteobacteria bacterium]
MKFGVCVASHINDIDYIVRAEELGFHSAWLADSQMLWSDCYATLALAATRTNRIHLGTGVAVTGTRPPAVTASSIATINAIAPKRTFLGVGSGNTAMRVMGLPPQRIAEFDRYLKELCPLLRGQESLVRFKDEEIPIRHVMPQDGFVNFDDPIPLYVSGFGPKSLGLAGKHGDGAVLAMPANANIMANIWRMLEASSDSNRNEIDRNSFLTTALTAIVVLDPGEPIDSPRVKSECGAMAMAAIHFAYEQVRNFGRKPSGALAYVWEGYRDLIESYPEERRHQRIHAGHNCWVLPEEEKFLTPDVLRASSLIGTRDEIIDQLGQLHEAGLNQVMVLPNFDTRYSSIERLAKDIVGNVH